MASSASASARLTAQVVLPSPGRALVTAMMRGSAREKSRWRSRRYFRERCEPGSRKIIRRESRGSGRVTCSIAIIGLAACATSARIGCGDARMIGNAWTSLDMAPPRNFNENGCDLPDVALFVDAVVEQRPQDCRHGRQKQ